VRRVEPGSGQLGHTRRRRDRATAGRRLPVRRHVLAESPRHRLTQHRMQATRDLGAQTGAPDLPIAGTRHASSSLVRTAAGLWKADAIAAHALLVSPFRAAIASYVGTASRTWRSTPSASVPPSR
jgi:hypothetical protein